MHSLVPNLELIRCQFKRIPIAIHIQTTPLKQCAENVQSLLLNLAQTQSVCQRFLKQTKCPHFCRQPCTGGGQCVTRRLLRIYVCNRMCFSFSMRCTSLFPSPLIRLATNNIGKVYQLWSQGFSIWLYLKFLIFSSFECFGIEIHLSSYY